jgi:hypothetical protein
VLQSIIDQLPNQPHHQIDPEDASWSNFKLDPEEAEDYAAQDDLAVGTTMVPDVKEAAISDVPFYSQRYSRHGETFCYLKLDMAELSLDERFTRKQQIEEALDPSLREEGIGCVVGSGTGLRYAYLDLAVTDIPKTVQLVRRRLLALDLLPGRSWLLFFDAELSREYIGLRTSTPPPPGMPAE